MILYAGIPKGNDGYGPEPETHLRDRQEITWTFECPIAPHLGSLLNRKIRDVERLRLWYRSIGRDPICGTLGPQIVQLISCRPLMRGTGDHLVFWSNNINLRYPIRDPESFNFVTVVDDKTSRLYVNVREVAQATQVRTPNFGDYAKRIYLGRPTVSNLRYFNGTLDDLRLYHESLNAAEVMKLYASYRDEMKQ